MSILIFTTKDETSALKELLMNGGYREPEFCHHPSDFRKKLHIGDLRNNLAAEYSLILIDLSAAREGLNLCREIRESSPYFECPLIILSESNTQEVFQIAFANGASDFLTKPSRDFELLTRIRVALRMKYETDRRKSREKELLEVTRQLADANTVLDRLALVDSLTGIPNRRCFDQSLVQEMKISRRRGTALSLLMLDIDAFKLFNDNYGHQSGDNCLSDVGTEISRSLCRPSDMACRYGGEEFAAILPDTDESGARVAAEKIRHAIESLKIPHETSDISPWVTVSIGIACCYPELNQNPKDLISQADKALYQAKAAGRNQCFVSQPGGKTTSQNKKKP